MRCGCSSFPPVADSFTLPLARVSSRAVGAEVPEIATATRATRASGTQPFRRLSARADGKRSREARRRPRPHSRDAPIGSERGHPGRVRSVEHPGRSDARAAEEGLRYLDVDYLAEKRAAYARIKLAGLAGLVGVVILREYENLPTTFVRTATEAALDALIARPEVQGRVREPAVRALPGRKSSPDRAAGGRGSGFPRRRNHDRCAGHGRRLYGRTLQLR